MAWRLISFVSAFLLFSGLAPPVHTADLLSVDEAEVIIAGTSTVRDWKCDGKAAVEAVEHGKVDRPLPADFTGKLEAVVKLSVQTERISCKEKLMVEHLRNALKVKANPQIIFVMNEAEFFPDKTVLVSGTLTIAGVSKAVKVQTKITRSADGLPVITGEVSLDMREYNVKPPSLMLGTVSVGPKITIRITFKVQPQWMALSEFKQLAERSE